MYTARFMAANQFIILYTFKNVYFYGLSRLAISNRYDIKIINLVGGGAQTILIYENRNNATAKQLIWPQLLESTPTAARADRCCCCCYFFDAIYFILSRFVCRSRRHAVQSLVDAHSDCRSTRRNGCDDHRGGRSQDNNATYSPLWGTGGGVSFVTGYTDSHYKHSRTASAWCPWPRGARSSNHR